MKVSRAIIGLMPVLIAMAVVLWLVWSDGPGESLVDRAHRECSACGLKDSEIDGLIDAMRASSANRDELLRRYKQTYVAGRPEPVCLPCIHSMIDAVLEARDE